MYFSLRACAELSAETADGSFMPSVSLKEARETLHAIDEAASTMGIATAAIWADAAPQAAVTAEAIKAAPERLEYCHRLGGVFRVDAASLQKAMRVAGVKGEIIPKDF